MEPAHTPERQTHDTPQPQFAHSPQGASASSKIKGLLSRTSSAFTAEYSVFLIALSLSLSTLTWLVYIFFGLVASAMHGGAASSYVSTQIFALWLGVSSLITLPVTAVLWSRTQGEIAHDSELKGELPKGAAKGFRTFWVISSALGILGFAIAAIFAPIAAAIGGSDVVVEVLLMVTLPSLFAIAISVKGVYIVTRNVSARRLVHMLMWVVVAVTAVLFVADYIWAANTKTIEPVAPTYTSPTVTDPYNYDYNSDSSPYYRQ